MRNVLLTRLKRDTRGVAVIELALIAPVLAIMVVGVIDMSNGINRKLQLEQAAQRSLEMILQTTGNDTTEAAITAQVVQQAGVEAGDVVVARRLECGGVAVPDITAECDPLVTEARYITVTVTDKYTPMFRVHFTGLNADGTYHIAAKAGMRTQ